MVEKNYSFYGIYKNFYLNLNKFLKNNKFFIKFDFCKITKIFIKNKKGYKNSLFLKRLILKDLLVSINLGDNYVNNKMNCKKFFFENNNLISIACFYK